MLKSLLKFLGLSIETKDERSKRELEEQILKSIEDFKNRPIHKELTIEIINSINDELLLQTIFDNLCEKFSNDYRKEYETVLEFNKYQQAIYVIWVLEAEINNGGFNQYYENSSGQFAKLTPAALELIGANRFSDILVRVNHIYETQHETITKYMDGSIEGFSKSYQNNPLNEFDDEFFELYKKENLSKLQIAFIKENKVQFVD